MCIRDSALEESTEARPLQLVIGQPGSQPLLPGERHPDIERAATIHGTDCAARRSATTEVIHSHALSEKWPIMAVSRDLAAKSRETAHSSGYSRAGRASGGPA